MLFNKTPIRHLNLTSVEPVADELFQSPHLCKIITLALAECKLTDSHMKLLAESPYLGELPWLSLVLNNIGMTGAEYLAQSEGLGKLSYVNLYGNEVDPTEYLVVDQGVILERILPGEGEELEARFGPIYWLNSESV